jgi:hypothetical protein
MEQNKMTETSSMKNQAFSRRLVETILRVLTKEFCMKKKVFLINPGMALVAVLAVMSLTGCLSLLTVAGAAASELAAGNRAADKNAIPDWLDAEIVLMANVVPSEVDGNLKLQVQYEVRMIPVLKRTAGNTYSLDKEREAKKELRDVPIDHTIALQWPDKRSVAVGSVKEAGYIKFDRAVLREYLHNDSRGAANFIHVASGTTSGTGTFNQKTYTQYSYYTNDDEKILYASDEKMVPASVDITDYAAGLYAESEKNAVELAAKIAALDDGQYPLTNAGFSNYEKAVRAMVDERQTLQPEITVINDAINARKEAVSIAEEERRKILITPNEFAQLGSYTFYTGSSTVHVIVLPEGIAEMISPLENGQYRKYQGSWSRRDNGFIVNIFIVNIFIVTHVTQERHFPQVKSRQ